MSKSPLVSIITPVADRHQYIGQCFESVLSQIFSSRGHIIVDDSIGEEAGKVGRILLSRQRYKICF